MPQRRELHHATARSRFNISARRLTALLAAALGTVAIGLPATSQLLDSTLDDLVDRQIAEQVEEEIAQALEDLVEQQVESGVAQQIEQDVASAVEQQLESEIVHAVQQQVESSVVATIATQVEASVAGELGDELDETVRVLSQGGLRNDNTAGDPAPSQRFAANVDALGRAIEREVWIILVPNEHAARIAGWGFAIQERQELATLDRVLLRVTAPENRDIAQAALDLALDAPGVQIDFNHVYRPSAEADDTLTAVPAIASHGAAGSPAPALSLGIVDTAVDGTHEALRAADVVQRDFVPFAAERPTAHGTAVASIVVGEAAQLRPQLPGGRLYAASVFFLDPDGNNAATAASLTVAGDWLAAQGVRVINMSLAGPPNRVLEAAIAALVERSVIVVAAVGNNGPNGAPLYPAAYPNVVGVTAIDDAQRVYRYANRGPHVMFSAPGVDVPVATTGGGYTELTGTSVAAPHAAAVIVHARADRPSAAPADVLAELQRNTVDLGDKSFDTVFGYGRIAPPAFIALR